MKGHSKRKRHSSQQKNNESNQSGCFQLPLAHVDIERLLRENLHGFAVDFALILVRELLEDELRERCGNRYERSVERMARRHGKQRGSVVIAGRKVPIDKPRARGAEGEIESRIYSLLNRPDAMPEAVLRRLVNGVSCRDYNDVLDPFTEGFGVERSSVSRSFVEASEELLDKFARRRFEADKYLIVYVDGIEYGGEMMVVAMGVNHNGIKQLLGVRQGATENSEVCKDLFQSLVERGLTVNRPTLFVIDGSKALRKAIVSHFGEYAFIQRCQVHKKRNVKAYLSDSTWEDISSLLSAAYNETDYERALNKLRKAAEWLERINPSAAESLREGMEETLTVIRLGVPEELRKTLATTNPIESALSVTRARTGRVKRWRPGDMRLRWCSAGLLEAERRFRRVRGYNQLNQLETALQTAFTRKSLAPDTWVA